jgi:surfeit locus 1 family protein
MSGARFWIVSTAAVVGIAGTFALGSWQLGRAHQKEALSTAITSRGNLPPLPPQALLAPDVATQLHRPVRLRGTWVADRTVFLENRQMGGRVGFYVATPLRLAGTDRAVLVQRGWAPRNFAQRDALPAVETPAGDIELGGRIAPPPAKLYQFGSAGSGPIRQNLDLAPFAAETGLRLLPITVMETGPASQGLLREWPETGGRGPETNYGYAAQWWALSALIAILYAWYQFILPRRRAKQA